jgi:hypothetical protein
VGACAADFGGLIGAFHLDFLTVRVRHYCPLTVTGSPERFPKGFLGKA